MDAFVPSRRRPGLLLRLRRGARGATPLLAWLAAVIAVVHAIAGRQQEFAAEAAAELPEDTVLAPLRWQLQAQENAIERLAAAAAQLDLRAPMAGVVASLPHQGGEWLAAGDTVLTIVAAEAEHILAFVPAALRHRFAAAATIDIERCSRPLAIYPVRVLSISPAPVPVPEQLWQVPRQQEWAFEVVLAATGTELPGERVRA